jgi:glycosyltransferase involved in cell wall biosynthesis
MKISVVVCAKNDAFYLKKCLSALKKQILRPEIVVVYGKSSDNTKGVAQRYADVIVRDDGTGLTAARNIGWRHSTGDIIAYCDADNLPNKDWTARIAQHFTNPKLLALSGPLILSGKSSLKLRMAFKLWAELFPSFFAAFGHHNLWGAHMAFRKEVLKKFHFQGRFLEDYEIGSRIRVYLRRGGSGKIKFDYKLKMPTSDRRFKKSFHRIALKYYVGSWLRINFHKPAKGYYVNE